MILPVAKLGALALKTISKRVGNSLKKEAGRHPKFRELIISIAQANHRVTTNLQRRLYGHATNVAIRPLDEEKAVQSAADIFGEVVVFLVAGSAVVFEVQRSAKSEARKEDLRKQELEVIKQNETEMARKIESIQQQIVEIKTLTQQHGQSTVKFQNRPQIQNLTGLLLLPNSILNYCFHLCLGGCCCLCKLLLSVSNSNRH